MTTRLAHAEELIKLCREVDISQETEALTAAINDLMPDLNFQCVLTRGHWYRPGGVVDKNYQSVNDNIAQWAEHECNGDVDEIILKHVDSGYFATKFSGKTHYFTAPNGKDNEDFIQLEIEELEEVVDRALVDRDWFPDSLEDFIDPLDFPRLDPEPTGKKWYQFRRITNISNLMQDILLLDRSLASLKRFFQDWNESSACDGQPFCRHWILALREYQDSHGEHRISAKPVSTYAEQLPQLPPAEILRGTELSNAIHSYDRQLEYPFAWFFIMLSAQSSNYQLAQAVLEDQLGVYEYLPAKDLKILRQWEERPYAI
jgi:hypothetical protein